MKGAVRYKLVNSAAVTNLVGTAIYNWPAPQNAAYPFITIERITKETDHNLSVGHPDYVMEDWQIDAWSDNEIEAEQIDDAIRGELDIVGQTTFEDPQKLTSSATFYVYLFHHESTIDVAEPDDDGSQNTKFRKLATYNCKRSKTSS